MELINCEGLYIKYCDFVSVNIYWISAMQITQFKHRTTLSCVDYVCVTYIYTFFVKGMISGNDILKTNLGFNFL
jgi:hypothetical protein